MIADRYCIRSAVILRVRQTRKPKESTLVPSQLVRVATEVAYAARQLPRVAWYLGHSLLLRELSQAVREREAPDTPRRVQTGNARVPDRARIYADMAKVFLQDLANVVAGIYPIPADHDGSFSTLVHRSRIFLDDLPSIHRRRKRRAHDEVLNETTRGKRPRYYLQNFHYQSGGWLTAKSAELYDTQVEIFSTVRPMRSGDRHCHNSTRFLPDRINASCRLSILAVVQDDLSMRSNRSGRSFCTRNRYV